MKLNFRIEQDFGCDEPIKPSELAAIFQGVSKHLNILLGTKKTWYEQGYSRKQALQHKIFTEILSILSVLLSAGMLFSGGLPYRALLFVIAAALSLFLCCTFVLS